ncbi:MAG: PHP domain-containing protein, partial [Chloroflexota bacterium]
MSARSPNQGALKPVWADLHLHTVVSACAEVEMIPPLIIEQARALGLGIIAVTDPHTADNVAAVQRA